MKSISMGAKRTISNDRRKKRKKNMVTTTVAHPNWSGLHQDLIRCFAEQIVSMKDFFAFRGVNKSWRSEAIKENSNASLRLQHKVPIILLLEEINAPIRNIHSLTKGHTYQLDLPETCGKFCYSSSDLWPGNLRKFVLSSSPSWTSNYGVLLLSHLGLAIYKPGYNNGKWIDIYLKGQYMLMDALYYKGQFYAVDYLCRVFVCEIQDLDNAHLRLVAPQILDEQLFGLRGYFTPPYLMESATGALLLVIVLRCPNNPEVTCGCRVLEVPLDNGKSWSESEVKNLGNRTLFLGANSSSFSIEALDDSICKPNCIYFLNRRHFLTTTVDIDIGIYSMEDGKIDRHLESLLDFKNKGSSLTSHSWLQPSF